MNNWKKKEFFIVIFRGAVRGSFPSTVNPLCHPEPGLCWGHPVTWAEKQTKSRNVENSVTAHKYKLCDKGVHQVPVFNGFLSPVFQKSAVRIELTLFNRPGQPPEDPPPLEKLTGGALPLPLLPAINWRLFPKPFFASGDCPPGSALCSKPGSFPPRPASPLVGKGGSGGILPLFASRSAAPRVPAPTPGGAR